MTQVLITNMTSERLSKLPEANAAVRRTLDGETYTATSMGSAEVMPALSLTWNM